MPTTTMNAEAAAMPIDLRRGHALRRLAMLSTLLDSAWRIPGTSRRFGLDAVATVVPFAGSFVGAAVSSYFVWEALRAGAPPRVLLHMLRNIGVDWLLGEIPVIGVVFDLFYKANEANLRLLTAWLRGESPH